MTWLWLLPLAGGVALAVLCGHILVQLRRADARLEVLLDRVDGVRPETREMLASLSGTRLTMEVLNPLEVATGSSRLAGPVSWVSPTLVQRRVYAQMGRELQQELSRRGIEVHVDVQQGRW